MFVNPDLPSYPHLAGFSAFFQRYRIPPAFLRYVFLPIFSETCYSFSLGSLFFLKTYNIFLRNTIKRGYFQSFLALLSCVVARSLKYRLAHSNCLNHQDHILKQVNEFSYNVSLRNILIFFCILGLDRRIILKLRIMKYVQSDVNINNNIIRTTKQK